jgi:hypothetical protein
MKLPTLWIAAAFAAGIGLVTRWAGHPSICVAVALLAILAGGILIWRQLLFAAALCALVAWTALGGLALGIELAVVPADHVTPLIAANRIDLTEPLRWRGRLREDPLVMPWGRRFEIDIEQVESGGQILPASGGLRANIYNNPRQPIEVPDASRGRQSRSSRSSAAAAEFSRSRCVRSSRLSRAPENRLDRFVAQRRIVASH